MHSRRRDSVLALLAVAALTAVTAPASAQHDAHAAGQVRGRAPAIGTIVFPNSGNAAAQEPFLRGVAFLHNFEYPQAAAAFRSAQKADPGFALAYWGEALTYSHVVWRTEDLGASRAALHRLGATSAERLAKAKTSRERQFGAAVEAFYKDGALAQRVSAYADSLRKFAQANPADQEAAAFASHALMMDGLLATSQSSRDALLREAIALSQKVILSNANHPGATHYLIHLFDSPGMAAQGLEFARAYDKIAPDAEHALHMPSHIYLQLGMWSDVVSSNERAWVASRADNAPSWHTLSWLQYGYLQQGRWAAAEALIDTARAIVPTQRGYESDGAFAVSRLEFQYAASSGQWIRPLTQPPTATGEVSEREAGFRRFAAYWSAVDAAQRNDAPALARFAVPFVARVDSVLAGTSTGAGSAVALANAFVVHALVAKSKGDTAAYLGSLRAATERERKLEAFVGPPERVFASELLGDELIARGRGAEAVSYFETVLRLCPGRSEALLGLARAKTAAGDRAGGDSAFARLRANYSRADAAALMLLGERE